MRKLAYLLIVAGICIVLYPKMTVLYSEHKQDGLLQAIESADTDANNIATAYDKGAGLMSNYAKVSRWLEEMNTESEQEGTSVESAALDVEKGVGTIIIGSIDLKLPVLEGASKQNLQHAAAHMTETAPLGQVGNTAIAAHRSRTSGRLFNRLGEVEIGDEIVVRSKGEQFVYSVYQISVVKPTDVSVLEGNDQDKILTLITCEPLVNPTHRLIVHAKQAGMDHE